MPFLQSLSIEGAWGWVLAARGEQGRRRRLSQTLCLSYSVTRAALLHPHPQLVTLQQLLL